MTDSYQVGCGQAVVRVLTHRAAAASLDARADQNMGRCFKKASSYTQ